MLPAHYWTETLQLGGDCAKVNLLHLGPVVRGPGTLQAVPAGAQHTGPGTNGHPRSFPGPLVRWSAVTWATRWSPEGAPEKSFSSDPL